MLDAVVGRPEIRLTFDDANASDRAHALPELLARGLRATFFVVAGRIDRPGFLTADSVRELAAAGMMIQSHGMRHRLWRGMDSVALEEELVTARERLEDVVGTPITEVAIPFCQYDRGVLRHLRAAGYRRVYTCDRGPARPGAWLQARNQISAGDDARKVDEITSPTLGLRLEIAAKAPIKRWR